MEHAPEFVKAFLGRTPSVPDACTCRWVALIAAVAVSLLAIAVPAWPATLDAPPAQDRSVVLEVPYLPQSEALCGGASAAMVMRYWGDRHATVAQFAPLVDRKAAGIRNDVLVAHLEARGWRATRVAERSIDALRGRLAAGEPPILLLEDRPGRYHYVVMIGADDEGVVVHDPAWGPARRLANRALLDRWEPSGRWSVVVRPGERVELNGPPQDPSAFRTPETPCGRQVDEAVALVASIGRESAAERLNDLRAQCPTDGAPSSELAGIRFAERRWRDAESLADEAVARDPTDAYAWDVLGAARYMQRDLDGALQAWNTLTRPRIDAVQIEGLSRVRYELAAETIDLAAGDLLTSSALQRAERRLRSLPSIDAVRLTYRRDADGFAIVDAHVLERTAMPSGAGMWVAAALRTVVSQSLRVAVPGSSGQGEVWSAAYRWWPGRPRFSGGLAIPRHGAWPGIWRIELSRETETFRVPADSSAHRETMTTGRVSVEDWATASTWYQVRTGVHAWDGDAHSVSAGVELMRRVIGDHVVVSGSTEWYMALDGAASFGSAGVTLAGRVPVTDRWTLSTRAGLDVVTADAPMAVWPGADAVGVRPRLLRAHPILLDDAIAGPAFGRRMRSANVEIERALPGPFPIGAAAFVDMASASDRVPGVESRAFHVDAGGGLRLRLPGSSGAFRIDYARGLRDGAHAISAAFQID